MKIEVVSENPDGSTFEAWTGEGAREAARALVQPDWIVLVEPAGRDGETGASAH